MALVQRYVRADAAGGGDGTTTANSGANGAYTWAEMFADINGGGRAGYVYNVMKTGGTFSFATSFTFTGDGDLTAPIVIRGCDTIAGDATRGRLSTGKLDVSKMPLLTFTNNGITSTTGTQLIFEALRFETSRTSYFMNFTASDLSVINCEITQTGTNASSGCVTLPTNGGHLLDCDLYQPNTPDGAVVVNSGRVHAGNRVETNSDTIGLSQGNGTISFNNLVIGAKIGINKPANNSAYIYSNTLVNCVNGIEFLTGGTAAQSILGNHITGCSGWGIQFNTATNAKFLGMNRFRDNFLGNISADGDWPAATSFRDVISNDTDADDFIDAGSGNYGLKSTAPGAKKSFGQLLDIGATGSEASVSPSTVSLHPLAFSGGKC